MSRSRPFGITVLAILAGIDAIFAIIHTLQMLRLFPIFLGPVTFFTFSLLGALLWGLLAAIWIWVARGLWNLDPEVWLFVVVMATLNLVMAVVSILGSSSWQALAATLVLNGVILLYALTPTVKNAFGVPSSPA